MPAHYDEAYEDGGEPRPHYRAVLEALARRRPRRARRAAARARARARGPLRLDRARRVRGRRRAAAVHRARSGTRSTAASPSACARSTPSCATPTASGGSSRPGVVPARLIEDGAFYEPDMQGVEVPVWAGFAGLDVVRGADGEFSVLEDNLRMPTGLGFAPLAWEAGRRPARRRLPERAPGARRGDRALRGDPALGGARRPRRPLDRRARRRLRERRAVGDLRRRVPPRRADGHARRPARSARAASTPTSTARRREVDVIYRRSNYHLLRDEDGSPERARPTSCSSRCGAAR